MPGDDLLFHRLSDSTIGAVGFHGRVRDGIGWDTDAIATRQWSGRIETFGLGVARLNVDCDGLLKSMHLCEGIYSGVEHVHPRRSMLRPVLSGVVIDGVRLSSANRTISIG